MEDQKPLRGRNQDAICAACLYLACRIENKARTIAGIKHFEIKYKKSFGCQENIYLYICLCVTEIYSVANGATKKEIGRASDFIKKQLDGEGQTMEVSTVQAGDLLVNIVSQNNLYESKRSSC